MTTKDAITWALKTNQAILANSLSDLTDADLFVRPAPGANHIAWQLGHLITAEATVFLPKVPGAKPPQLPDGFAARHAKDVSANDDPAGFRTREEYLALYKSVRAATLAAAEGLSDEDLDRPSNWRPVAPTVGTLLLMIANHDMMHAGQFTVVRRKLGKPVLF
jgi:hypothetical protein